MWMRSALMLVLAGVVGCTGLAGLDDLAFGDPQGSPSGGGTTTTTSAGGSTDSGTSVGGGDVTTSTSGVGGGGASFALGCAAEADVLDVAPMKVGNLEAAEQGLSIAALGDAFGIVTASSYPQPEEIKVVIIGHDGLVRRRMDIPSFEGNEFEQNITASATHFAVPSPRPGNKLEVHYFDAWLDETDVATVDVSWTPVQALATGTANGFLLTLLDGAQIRSTFLPGFGAGAPNPLNLLPNNGYTTCCTYRAWHAGRYDDGTFGVMWKPSANQPPNEFVAVDTTGEPDATSFEIEDMPVPEFAGALGDTLLFADCEKAAIFSQDGYLLDVQTIGSGDTCAVASNAVKRSDALPAPEHKIVYICDTAATPAALYRNLAAALGLAPEHRRDALWRQLKSEVRNLIDKQNIVPILVLDEAQHLGDDFFVDFSGFLNYAFDRQTLLTVWLCGLPSLRTRLDLQHHKPLRNRIISPKALRPKTRDELLAMVAHGMKVAGGNVKVFADPALEVLYRASHGVPRTASHLLRLSLVCAHERERDFVDEDTMLAACHELELIIPQQDQRQPARANHAKSRR